MNAEVYGELSTNLFKLDKVCLVGLLTAHAGESLTYAHCGEISYLKVLVCIKESVLGQLEVSKLVKWAFQRDYFFV